MSCIVFGSNGMLGNYLSSFLKQHMKDKKIICLSRKEYDVNELDYLSLESIMDNLNLKKGDVIINCIGIIPQSKNDKTRDYIKINSLFPIMLSIICKHNSWNFIHITTDCVFSGSSGKYDEKSIHDETNIYGITKSLGELGYGTIIRTSIIGEEKQHNRSLLECVRSNKNGIMNGYMNHLWNGVTCLELSRIICEIIEKNLFWTGVRHIFSPNIVSKYELIKMINEIYELNIDIHPVDTEKTIDKSLSTCFSDVNQFKIPDIRKQIEELSLFYKQIEYFKF